MINKSKLYPPVIIDNAESLLSLVECGLSKKYIAVDTEFVWERTYYPKLGLVQIGFSDKECFLIDVPAVKDISPLGKLLKNPSIIKILHDSQQDLTILEQATGTFPNNIFDTRRAAGFAEISASISLGNLLNELFSINLDKTETRTNWLKRPLSDNQIEYAANDIRFMPAVREELLSRIKKLGNLKLLQEEFELYDNPDLYKERAPDKQFKRIKGVNRFSPLGLSVFRELAGWRDLEARRQNRPRSHIVPDELLIKLALGKPRSTGELESQNIPFKKEIKKYGISFIKAINTGFALPEKERPQANTATAGYTNVQTDFMLSLIKERGISRGVDPSIIASRGEITALLKKGPAVLNDYHNLLNGWRKEFTGEELRQLLTGKLSVTLNPETGLPNLVKRD